jgi:ssDNA-binding Zn-finger/Zn-ribbon topoisomerase 1
MDQGSEVKGKPICQECGKSMQVWKIEGDIICFRCSGYPACNHFKKYKMTEAKK